MPHYCNVNTFSRFHDETQTIWKKYTNLWIYRIHQFLDIYHLVVATYSKILSLWCSYETWKQEVMYSFGTEIKYTFWRLSNIMFQQCRSFLLVVVVLVIYLCNVHHICSAWKEIKYKWSLSKDTNCKKSSVINIESYIHTHIYIYIYKCIYMIKFNIHFCVLVSTSYYEENVFYKWVLTKNHVHVSGW